MTVDHPTLADLAANPAPTAKVDLDHMPEVLRGDDTEQAALRSVRIASSSAGKPPSAEGALPTLKPRLVEER